MKKGLQKIKKALCKKLCPKKKLREIVIVFPFNTKEKKLFLIQEYIHHYDKKFWKYVSGGIDKNRKDIKTHAVEELAEEVGMESSSVKHLYSSEKVFGNRGSHFYIAEDPIILENPPENPDTDFICDMKWVNEQEFFSMIDAGELLWDEASMCAIQVFRKYK